MGHGGPCIMRKCQAFSGPLRAHELPSKLTPAIPIPPRSEKSHRVRQVGRCGGGTGGVNRRGTPPIIAVRCPGTPGIPGTLAGARRGREEAVLCPARSISGKLPLTLLCFNVYPLREIQ